MSHWPELSVEHDHEEFLTEPAYELLN